MSYKDWKILDEKIKKIEEDAKQEKQCHLLSAFVFDSTFAPIMICFM